MAPIVPLRVAFRSHPLRPAEHCPPSRSRPARKYHRLPVNHMTRPPNERPNAAPYPQGGYGILSHFPKGWKNRPLILDCAKRILRNEESAKRNQFAGLDYPNWDTKATKRIPKMASIRQIEANRQNALKCTGPQTPEGKAASSQNALVHGLTATKNLPPGEDPDGLLLLAAALREQFQPANAYEELLVNRFANAEWRLARMGSIEAGIFLERIRDIAETRRLRTTSNNSRRGGPDDPSDEGGPAELLPDHAMAAAFIWDCNGPNSFNKLVRYERTLESVAAQCLKTLERSRAHRETQPNSPPQACIDVPEP